MNDCNNNQILPIVPFVSFIIRADVGDGALGDDGGSDNGEALGVDDGITDGNSFGTDEGVNGGGDDVP